MKLAWTTAADADAMASVHAEAFEDPLSAQAFVDLMDGPGVFGLLAGEEPALGVILCRVVVGEMEVLTIGVSPAARRQGVARALITHVEAAARAAGAGGVVIITGFDNVGAQAAYRASGYVNWALAMEKRFSNE